MSSEALTEMYIQRLKKHGPELECVVTITEELALKQARKADLEISRGKYRGLLHGIPWGAKDLLAVPGYKTTWGAMPFKDQILDADPKQIALQLGVSQATSYRLKESIQTKAREYLGGYYSGNINFN